MDSNVKGPAQDYKRRKDRKVSTPMKSESRTEKTPSKKSSSGKGAESSMRPGATSVPAAHERLKKTRESRRAEAETIAGQLSDRNVTNSTGTMIHEPTILNRHEEGHGASFPGAQAIDSRGGLDHYIDEPTVDVSSPVQSSLDYLTEAHAVDDYVVASETVDVEKLNTEERKRRRTYCILSFLAALVVVGCVAIPVVIFTRNGADAPTLSPSLAPSFSENGVASFITTLSSASNLAIPSSPQARAFEWITNEDAVKPISEEDLKQRYVLATFYFATNGDNWQSNANWISSTESVCNWSQSQSGTTVCNADGLLRELRLDRNNMQGTIVSELSHLADHLEVLDLTINDLTGTLPTFLGLMSNLEILHVSTNAMTGKVPTEFGNLSSMRQLYVDANMFTGTMPRNVCNLNVEKLWADCAEIACNCSCRCCSEANPCS